MLIDKILNGPLEKELVKFLMAHLSCEESTAVIFVEKIKNGEFSIKDQDEFAKLELAFQKFLKDKFGLNVDTVEDTSNQKDARNLAIQTRSKIPDILSVIITVGFFGVLGYMLLSDVKPADTLLIMLGSLATAWAAIVNYWFGSSSGSLYKNDIIEKMSKR